jgi:hypothetical protein
MLLRVSKLQRINALCSQRKEQRKKTAGSLEGKRESPLVVAAVLAVVSLWKNAQ